MKTTKTKPTGQNSRFPSIKSYAPYYNLLEEVDMLDTDEDRVMKIPVDVLDSDEDIIIHYYEKRARVRKRERKEETEL